MRTWHALGLGLALLAIVVWLWNADESAERPNAPSREYVPRERAPVLLAGNDVARAKSPERRPKEKSNKFIRVHGRVVNDTTGEPIEGATVSARPKDSVSDRAPWFNRETRWSVETTEDGQFVVHINRATWWETLSVRGHAKGYAPKSSIERPPTAGIDAVEISFRLAPLKTVTVSFVDEGGKPVTPTIHARVELAEALGLGVMWMGQAVQDGQMNLSFWPSATATVFRVAATGYAEIVLAIGPGEREQTVRLRRGTRVVGRVVDASGVPVANARITIRYREGYTFSYTSSESDGRFTLEHCPLEHGKLHVLTGTPFRAGSRAIKINGKDLDVGDIEVRAVELDPGTVRHEVHGMTWIETTQHFADQTGLDVDMMLLWKPGPTPFRIGGKPLSQPALLFAQWEDPDHRTLLARTLHSALAVKPTLRAMPVGINREAVKINRLTVEQRAELQSLYDRVR